jgi:hypothetical protein
VEGTIELTPTIIRRVRHEERKLQVVSVPLSESGWARNERGGESRLLRPFFAIGGVSLGLDTLKSIRFLKAADK